MSLPPNSAVLEFAAMQGGIPKLELPDGRVIEKPSPEYLRHMLRWRWLLDSYEGGEAYRTASYGTDLRGMPVRNLIRHKREYPLQQDAGYSPQTGRPVGTDQAAQATDDDYELRRARTPIPTFVSEAIGEHHSKIYNQEIRRAGPEKLIEWWKDVDGRGASIDQWMKDVFAPLFVTFGQLDVIVDNPALPAGETVNTRADELRLGLDRCLASYILPVNIPWWRVDLHGRYTEVVVREIDDDGVPAFRYWNASEWIKYNAKGEKVGGETHTHGVVPIVRLFCKRRPSCKHIGMPPYEAIAEAQREFYNRDSELILSDTLQAHPTVQGPKEYVRPDSTIPFGPGFVLPLGMTPDGKPIEWKYLDPPKGAADSLRTNKNDLRDSADRAACLTKPAGVAGTSGQTVGQSGYSKRLDQSTGNELLGDRAGVLQKAEETIAELAMVVMKVKPPADDAEDAVKIVYPRQFDLMSADELMTAIQNFELVLSQVGDAPETEGALLCKAVRLMLPGCDDDEYEEMDAEIEALLEKRQADKEAQREAIQTSLEQGGPNMSPNPNGYTDPTATDATGKPETE